MYVVTNRLKVPAERAVSFEQAFVETMHGLRDVPGSVRSQLLRPGKGSDEYLSVTEFDTKEHFEAWLRSDHFRQSHIPRGVQTDPTGNVTGHYEQVHVTE